MAPPINFSRFGATKGKSEVERLFDDTKLGECPEAEGSQTKLSPAERAQLIINEVSGVLSLYNISDKDFQFLQNIRRTSPNGLSFKQEKWMKDLEQKIQLEKDKGDKE